MALRFGLAIKALPYQTDSDGRFRLLESSY